MLIIDFFHEFFGGEGPSIKSLPERRAGEVAAPFAKLYFLA
jgi:hypothetical protein